jgi:copper oxidase (laccase) domain-containing protein
MDASGGAAAYFLPAAQSDHTSEPRWMLDLVAASRDQILECGLLPERIHVVGACTVCHEELFFSYRRDGAATGRMLSFIGLKKA